MKAKTIYDNAILIDAYEHLALSAIETFFNMLVWFACFPPASPHAGYLFLNCDLARLPVSTVKGKAASTVPLRAAKVVNERRDLMVALFGAISLS